jgi:dTDP-4-dehydrorhamnose reductase
MRIFVTGHRGQLGQSLFRVFEKDEISGCDLPEVDITDRRAISKAITDFAPDVVVHSAAWTDVDGCAREPEKAYQVNGIGTQNVALACAECDAAMAYVSTNEVFDGTTSAPYREWEHTHPINAYGRSKVAGEWYTQHLLDRFYITRTAWLYASGGRNFSNPNRIIQLADERGALKVVADEVGNPTFALDLAKALSTLVRTDAYGVYHLVGTGHCSRYEYVREVLRIAGRSHIKVDPVSLSDFERDSTPPAFSPLANTAAAALGITLRPWPEAVEAFLQIEN